MNHLLVFLLDIDFMLKPSDVIIKKKISNVNYEFDVGKNIFHFQMSKNFYDRNLIFDEFSNQIVGRR